MYKFQLKSFAFYREAALRGTDKKVNILEIAKQTRVPVPTLWKCVRDKVQGMGHRSGGPHQPKVLTKGTLSLFFHLNQIFHLKESV